MVSELEPTTKDIETAVVRPGLFISEPARQLLHENLLAQFAQDFVNVRFRVTFWDKVEVVRDVFSSHKHPRTCGPPIVAATAELPKPPERQHSNFKELQFASSLVA